eukprot:g29107.t1
MRSLSADRRGKSLMSSDFVQRQRATNRLRGGSARLPSGGNLTQKSDTGPRIARALVPPNPHLEQAYQKCLESLRSEIEQLQMRSSRLEEEVHKTASENETTGMLKGFVKALGGGVGALFSTTVLYPIEVTKTKVQAFAGKASTAEEDNDEKQKAMSNTFTAMAYTWKTEGLSASRFSDTKSFASCSGFEFTCQASGASPKFRRSLARCGSSSILDLFWTKGSQSSLEAGLVQLRRNRQLCDVTIASGFGKILAHKSVLAAHSEILARQLQDPWQVCI